MGRYSSKLTKETLELLYSKGISDQKIANHLGCHVNTVYNYCKRYGIDRAACRAVQEFPIKSAQHYAEMRRGFESDASLSRHLQISQYRLWYWKVKNGIDGVQRRYPKEIITEEIAEKALSYFEEFSRDFNEKIDVSLVFARVVRSCWILDYRRQHGESITLDHERRYLWKSYRGAVKKLLLKRSKEIEFRESFEYHSKRCI